MNLRTTVTAISVFFISSADQIQFTKQNPQPNFAMWWEVKVGWIWKMHVENQRCRRKTRRKTPIFDGLCRLRDFMSS